jgi:Major Facilitator Superfamily
MVGELVKNPKHEPKAFSIMPFVWSIGTIVGPAISGLLANPAKAYPDVFSKHGFFGHFPWALPNLICASLMLLSIFAGYFFLEETHPDLRKGADPFVYHHIAEQTPMITAAGATADPGVDLRQDSYGTFNEVEVPNKDGWFVNIDGTSLPPSLSEKSTDSCKWFTWQVAMLTVALGIFTYHSMCYDHLLPIFFQDDRGNELTVASLSLFRIPGGLGLSTKQVGMIMATNGLIALFIQGVVFPFAAEKLGIWRVFVLVTVLHPIAYFIVPYLALLPENLLFTGIYTCLTIRNLFSILAYPVLLILLKQASASPSVLGRINGLAASAGAACRTIAPPVAGLLYGWGSDLGFSGLAYWGTGFVALVGVAQLYFVPREKNDVSTVKFLVPGFSGATDQEQPVDVVDVTVVEAEQQV